MVSDLLYAGVSVDRAAVRMLGLDQPVYVQYGTLDGRILLRGTLGNSFFGDWSVEGAMPTRTDYR